MTKREIKEIIDAEIKWCAENPMNMPEDFRIGFVEGLKQAKRLIGAKRADDARVYPSTMLNRQWIEP